MHQKLFFAHSISKLQKVGHSWRFYAALQLFAEGSANDSWRLM